MSGNALAETGDAEPVYWHGMSHRRSPQELAAGDRRGNWTGDPPSRWLFRGSTTNAFKETP